MHSFCNAGSAFFDIICAGAADWDISVDCSAAAEQYYVRV